MSQFFEIHPINPQQRLIRQAAILVRSGGLIAYPTDSSYAFGWALDSKSALERVQTLRHIGKDHVFTLVCRDLADIAVYAKVDNSQYRLLKSATPGPFTFVLSATRELPRRVQHPKRKTVGIRVPDHAIVSALLAEIGEPLLSSTLILPDDELPLNDPILIQSRLGKQLELVIDGGPCGSEPTTVLDLSQANGAPQLLRQGKGNATPFL